MTFEPLGGGEAVRLPPDVAEPIGPFYDGQVLVGRLVPWEGHWWPALALSTLLLPDVPLPAEWFPLDPAGAHSLLALQEAMSLGTPSDAAITLIVAREACGIPSDQHNVWAEVRQAPSLVSCLSGQLARAPKSAGRIERLALAIATGALYDLWGFPAVRLYLALTGEGDAPGLRVHALHEGEGGVEEAEVRWIGPTGVRGARVFLATRDGGPRIFDARPALQMVPGTFVATLEYEAAQERGPGLPWRAPSPDPVEAKLRASIQPRGLAMDLQLELVATWRMAKEAMGEGWDRLAPEAWAAAVEAEVAFRRGQGGSNKELADRYGAKKSLVKARAEFLDELLGARRRR